ncbi:MAG: hypothetical protein GY724_21635 [Actinomycetia bacterium]|nr:hypothetical protein [Actinomycetes bacterium]MCP4227374.1 hypothetical protein [Actinomycetes bacterium]MCP5030316.1 hypothetical protein [Actinomycetes bacterium]
MVAFVTSIVAAVLMTLGILWYAKRRPVGAHVTWGEASVGAVYVFFLAFLAYGVIPHQWLTLAENELSWRADRMVHGPGGILKPKSQEGVIPFDITYRTISDSVAAMLYIVFLSGQIMLWGAWQNRGKAQKAGQGVVKSAYGRPLVKQG